MENLNNNVNPDNSVWVVVVIAIAAAIAARATWCINSFFGQIKILFIKHIKTETVADAEILKKRKENKTEKKPTK